MSTSAVSSNYQTTQTSSAATSTASANSLGDFESFITLLVTEMQNQDPTDPVSNTEFISQMAQISSLDRLNSLAEGMDASRAYSLLGKEVTYQTSDSSGETTTASGTVQSVVTKNNTTYLTIDGAQVELSSVVLVSASSSTGSAST